MLIDVHCHANLYLNIDEILKEAINSGVHKIIAVGMSETSLSRIIELSQKSEIIYPALGIHPEEVKMNKNIEDKLEEITSFIYKQKDKICAIGEIGLDYYFIKNEDLYSIQEMIFKNMLILAQNLELPINIHTKGAEKEVFDLLTSYNIPNVNVHWYSGPEEFLKEGIDRGYYFSITPAIKYSPPVKKVVSMVDQEHLLLESDGPVKYSGQIGSPSMIKNVLSSISKMKNISIKSLETQITKNTQKIFPRIF